VTAPRLPYQPPDWLTGDRIAVAVAALAAFGAASPRQVIIEWTMVGGPAIGVVAGACAGFALHLALRSTRLAGTLVRLVAATTILGALGALVHLFVSTVVGDGLLLVQVLWRNVLSEAVPVSLGASAAVAPLVPIIFWRRHRPSHDGPIRMLRDAGLWLLAASAIVIPLARHAVFVAGVATAGVMVAVALSWLGLRIAFVARLRSRVLRQATQAPPLSHDGPRPYLEEGVLPYRLGPSDATYELLVWNPPSTDSGAYRDTSQPVAMALVPVPRS
jgi:hypothetical protein